MKSYVFRVVIGGDELEDGGQAFHAYCPALKGCHTWGYTYEEALANIREAVELYMEDLFEVGEEIPPNLEEELVEWDSPAVVVNTR